MYKVVRIICNFFIFIYCKIVYRAKIVGTENIPKTGSIIFCANHKSFLDPPLLEVTCKRKDVRFVAKEELTKNKFLAFLGKVFDVILVKRNELVNGHLFYNSVTKAEKILSGNYIQKSFISSILAVIVFFL